MKFTCFTISLQSYFFLMVTGSVSDAKVDLNTFQSLLNRLEASKKRQQRQKSVEGRRDIYAGGLASMMSNF